MIPNYCKSCGEFLLPEQTECPFCGQMAVPVDELPSPQGHVWYACKQPCDKLGCVYCDGGLAYCVVCKKAEAELEKTCSGPALEERLRALDDVLAPTTWSGKKDFAREHAKLKARIAVREAADRIEQLEAALAAAARKGGDVQQAPGEAPQSGGDSRNAQKDEA